MPFRLKILDGSEPALALNAYGTPKLVEARHAVYKTIYDAPETTINLRERVLPRFVEAFDVAIDTLNDDDELWDEMHSLFTETEIGDVSIMAGSWVGYGRCLKALGVGSACEVGSSSGV